MNIYTYIYIKKKKKEEAPHNCNLGALNIFFEQQRLFGKKSTIAQCPLMVGEQLVKWWLVVNQWRERERERVFCGVKV